MKQKGIKKSEIRNFTRQACNSSILSNLTTRLVFTLEKFVTKRWSSTQSLATMQFCCRQTSCTFLNNLLTIDLFPLTEFPRFKSSMDVRMFVIVMWRLLFWKMSAFYTRAMTFSGWARAYLRFQLQVAALNLFVILAVLVQLVLAIFHVLPQLLVLPLEELNWLVVNLNGTLQLIDLNER